MKYDNQQRSVALGDRWAGAFAVVALAVLGVAWVVVTWLLDFIEWRLLPFLAAVIPSIVQAVLVAAAVIVVGVVALFLHDRRTLNTATRVDRARRHYVLNVDAPDPDEVIEQTATVRTIDRQLEPGGRRAAPDSAVSRVRAHTGRAR